MELKSKRSRAALAISPLSGTSNFSITQVDKPVTVMQLAGKGDMLGNSACQLFDMK